MSTSRPIIAVDFGTSACSVAVPARGGPSVVCDERGAPRMPSVVAVTQGAKRLVGQSAKAQAGLNRRNTALGLKHLLGRDFDDEGVRATCASLAFGVSPEASGVLSLELGGQRFSVEQVVGVLLERLRKLAEKYLGDEVKHAVLAAPATFDERRRQALASASESVGLSVLGVVHEPVAATLAHRLHEQAEPGGKGLVGVYDLGGGHFHFSVVDVSGGGVRYVGGASEAFIGGDAYDDRISGWIVDRALERSLDPRDDAAAMQRIEQVAEHVKRELSRGTKAGINLPYLCGEDSDLRLELSRAELESLLDDLVERTFDLAEQALDELGLRAEQLGDLLMCGEQSRMPRVRARALARLGRAPRRGVDAGEAVALGAAIYGERIGA